MFTCIFPAPWPHVYFLCSYDAHVNSATLGNTTAQCPHLWNRHKSHRAFVTMQWLKCGEHRNGDLACCEHCLCWLLFSFSGQTFLCRWWAPWQQPPAQGPALEMFVEWMVLGKGSVKSFTNLFHDVKNRSQMVELQVLKSASLWWFLLITEK